MAKHSSRKKSDNNVDLQDVTKQSVDKMIDIAAQYITEWTQNELKNFTDNKKISVCWPISTGGYRVGHDKIMQESDIWQRYDRNDEKKQEFPDYQTAIFYSLCLQAGYVNTAMKLCSLSRDVIKLKNDVKTFENSLKFSITAKDDFNITLYTSRYQHAVLQLKSCSSHLRKTMKSAKYIKFWEH
jgi:hypothetical protein